MAQQKFLTKDILKKTPALYAQDGKGEDAIAYAKFFNPCGRETWYMTEYDPVEELGYGKVVGDFTEMGYFSIPELMSIRLPFRMSIERDIHFRPKPLKDCE